METFVADFVKALPDALATAVVTILLTGGLLFLFQENIKSLFARSLFEHQTKFVLNHAKAVETLETLYQKFKILTDALETWINQVRLLFGPGKPKIDRADYLEKRKSMRAAFDDFWDYFQAHRLYLSTELIHEVWEIYNEVTHTTSMIEMAMDPDELPSSDEGLIDYLASIERMAAGVYGQTEKLEKLYKSIAEAQ